MDIFKSIPDVIIIDNLRPYFSILLLPAFAESRQLQLADE
jgi:hypothetical protein